MGSGNIWTFEPFQTGRRYRLRLNPNGTVITAVYVGEKDKHLKRPIAEREFEFETASGTKVFRGSDIKEFMYVSG